jgi:hypothetical protein
MKLFQIIVAVIYLAILLTDVHYVIEEIDSFRILDLLTHSLFWFLAVLVLSCYIWLFAGTAKYGMGGLLLNLIFLVVSSIVAILISGTFKLNFKPDISNEVMSSPRQIENLVLVQFLLFISISLTVVGVLTRYRAKVNAVAL